MKSLNIYEQKFKKFGVHSKSLLWQGSGASHQRFRVFWKEIDFNNKKVLDIGCGFGKMGKFLNKKFKNVDYKGIDITPEFIENGKRMYPYLKLEVGDFHELTKTEDSTDTGYDVVLASGVLNSNYGSELKNYDYRKKAIKKMFSLTNDIFAFNMLGTHPQIKNSKDSNIWYADSLEILKYCMTLTKKVVFKTNYNSKDFTVVMYK